MNVLFTKMQGLGNDFMVIDGIHQTIDWSDETIRRLADRHFGIGFDQLLLVESPRDTDTEFYYRIFNADGSEVEQCGNGARCFARFVRDKKLTDNTTIDVGTLSGTIQLRLHEDHSVTVNMGIPILEPENIPFIASAQAPTYPLLIDNKTLQICAVSMGNPHAVLQVDSIANIDIERLGPLIENHPNFPQRSNAGFMEIIDRGHIRLRVYERGTGETLACGTGACAAVVAGIIQGQLDDQVKVSLSGGELMIKWAGIKCPVWMSGPAEPVFEGRITL